MDTISHFGTHFVGVKQERLHREAAQVRQQHRQSRTLPGRFAVSLVAILALVFSVGLGSASAQEPDLGNDGIDQDCDDFPERNAVEGYFAHDGGSAERNVDGLDPDGNGIPCDEPGYDGEEPEDNGEEPADDTDDEPAEDDEGGAVTNLPTTGAGTANQAGTDVALVLTASGLFIVAVAAGAVVRFKDQL